MSAEMTIFTRSCDLMNEWAHRFNNCIIILLLGREIDALQKLGLTEKISYTVIVGQQLPYATKLWWYKNYQSYNTVLTLTQQLMYLITG